MTQSQFNTILSNAKALRARYPYMHVQHTTPAHNYNGKTVYDNVITITMYDTVLCTVTWSSHGNNAITITNGGWCSPTTIKRLNDIVDVLEPIHQMERFTRSNNILYHGTTPLVCDLPSNYHDGLGFGYGALSRCLGKDYSFETEVDWNE